MNQLSNPLIGNRKRVGPIRPSGSLPKLNRINPAGTMSLRSTTHSGRFDAVGKLENCVTRLQISQDYIERILTELSNLKGFLKTEVVFLPRTSVPGSIIYQFITSRLDSIRTLSETARFKGRSLIDGRSGVMGSVKGKGLYFVRGSSQVISSSELGYPVEVHRIPKSSQLIGAAPISEEVLKKERLISISIGSKTVNYIVERQESVESFVTHLQQFLTDHEVNIGVYKTDHDRLFFRHNKPGETHVFQGMSLETCLISNDPGCFQAAERGNNISGSIASEPAYGRGGYLIGKEGNRKTAGLVLYYDGKTPTSQHRVGTVWVEQNGMSTPMNPSGSQHEILSIPGVSPELLSVGVTNRCGFFNLDSIRVNSEASRRSSLRLITHAQVELKQLVKALKIKEEEYVELAVEFLRSEQEFSSAGIDIMAITKEKASEMVDQIKSMVSIVPETQ